MTTGWWCSSFTEDTSATRTRPNVPTPAVTSSDVGVRSRRWREDGAGHVGRRARLGVRVYSCGLTPMQRCIIVNRSWVLCGLASAKVAKSCWLTEGGSSSSFGIRPADARRAALTHRDCSAGGAPLSQPRPSND
eukprot:1943837-Prymnesium_polylepis.3